MRHKVSYTLEKNEGKPRAWIEYCFCNSFEDARLVASVLRCADVKIEED